MNKRSFQVKFIWFIFIFSLIVLMVNFFFLEFWYAERNGAQNGFVIRNTDYSIIYWFTHISYWSCIFVVTWASLELTGQYNEKFKPKFILGYMTTFFIVLTMCGEGPVLVGAMTPRWHEMWAVLKGGDWNGVEGFWYGFLDFFQFVSIHITIPLLVIIYMSLYSDKQITKNEVKYGVLFSSLFLVVWYIYVGVVTLFGVNGPYPIVDWTPDGNNDWALWLQLTLSILGLIFFTSINYIILKIINIKYNNGI